MFFPMYNFRVCVCVCLFPLTVKVSLTEQNNKCNAGQRWYAEEIFLYQEPLSPRHGQS